MVAVLSLHPLATADPDRPSPSPPAVLGLDHIPVAVADLEEAAERYRALGFTLKPGRPHANGIRNQHAKFADGTELELITAPEARDALTTTYRRHLAEGDGPAFLALYAPSMDSAAAHLDEAGVAHAGRGPYLDFDDRDGLGYLFLGPRNRSPTDRPEHFVHANGASSLSAVWLAGGDLSRERRLLAALGAQMASTNLSAPEPSTAPVARFAEGDVVFLPADRQLVPGRRIVGATLRVRSLAAAEAILAHGGAGIAEKVIRPPGASLYLPPSVTHGLWLELKESPWRAENRDILVRRPCVTEPTRLGSGEGGDG
jgi:catechol 2,3-dioxygenase-like lactoylglutathione lyase family enzyme